MHCGTTKLPHNRKVHHSFDELDLGHVIVEELLELVTAWSQGRPNRRAAPRNAARPAPPPPRCSHTIREPTLGLPGAALDRCDDDRRIALYGLGSPRGRGSQFPEGRRRSTVLSSPPPTTRGTAMAGVLLSLLLFAVCCLLFAVCCLLFVVCCLLFVVCCLLFVV